MYVQKNPERIVMERLRNMQMKGARSMAKNLAAIVACVVLIGGLAAVPFASAQSRVNDHDMEVMIRNLSADARSFQSAFKDSIHKSTVRGTSQEKQDRKTVELFTKQTDAMLNHFKKNKQISSTLPGVLATGAEIDSVVQQVHLDARTTSRWSKVRTELNQLASAAGIQSPLNQDPAQ